MGIVNLEKYEKESDEKLNLNEKLDNSDINEEKENKQIKYKALKNNILLSLSFFFQFLSFNGLNNLQSSINSENNLGIIAMLASTIFFTISCLFLPTIVTKYLGFKWSFIGANASISVYILANFYPRFYTLIPAAVLSGIGQSIMWVNQGSYTAELAALYAKATKKTQENALLTLFGVFLVILQLNQFVGNLISSFVLYRKYNIDFGISNETLFNDVVFKVKNYSKCGINDLPGDSEQIIKPEVTAVYILCSIYLIMSMIGTLILVIFMDNMKFKSSKNADICKTLIDSFKLFGDIKSWLLLPFLSFIAITSIFNVVDLTKSYISCPYGIEVVGTFFAIWGISSSLFSFLVGPVIQLIGRFICAIILFGVSFNVYLFLLFWTPTKDTMFVLYIVAAIYGILESAWGTINNATIGIVFRNNQQAAFSLNRFSLSTMFLVALTYSGYLSIRTKIYIKLSMTIFALFSFVIFHFITRKELESEPVNQDDKIYEND